MNHNTALRLAGTLSAWLLAGSAALPAETAAPADAASSATADKAPTTSTNPAAPENGAGAAAVDCKSASAKMTNGATEACK